MLMMRLMGELTLLRLIMVLLLLFLSLRPIKMEIQMLTALCRPTLF